MANPPRDGRRARTWRIARAELRRRLSAIAVLLPLLAAGMTTGSMAQQADASIPLMARAAGGTAQYVRISIGGGPAVPVSVDTGSAGLYVFRREVGPEVERTATPIHQGYVDGTRFDGYVGLATVRFPGTSLATTRMKIGVITQVSFAPEQPRCPGSDQKPGVMGVGMDTGGRLASPFAQLPGPAGSGFVVDARPGGAPHIILGPSAGTLARFRFVDLRPGRPSTIGLPSWDSGSARGCYRVNGEAAACQEVIFDTGEWDTVFDPGSAQTMRLGPHGFLLPDQSFELEVPGALHLRLRTDRSMYIKPKATPRSNSGTLLFRYVAVAFDMRRGRIGFE
ncbi:MAG: hypothetical protein J0H57_01530 [Rhodospirillales bacterium]|nr:hypothetical protein [Rhodospirillales bacterium]